jgi:hypothetical protein
MGDMRTYSSSTKQRMPGAHLTLLGVGSRFRRIFWGRRACASARARRG